MTPADARRRSRWWGLATVVVLVAAIVLAVVGIDMFMVPLTLAGTYCGMTGHAWSGWADGYRARQREETSREGS